MKHAEALENYQEFSGKASDVARSLAFAGIATIWVFKVDNQAGGFHVPQELVPPAIALISGLALDLVQYTYAAAAWGLFHRSKEKHHKGLQEKEFGAPRIMNWPTLACFWLKLLAVIVAYIFILKYLCFKLL